MSSDNLSISNLSWSGKEKIFNKIILKYNIKNIEIAPTKIWGSWDNINLKKIKEFKKKLNDKNINISSFQSLTFGFKESILNKDSNNFYESHFDKLIDYASILKTRALVFGSPSIRKFHKKRGGNPHNAVKFFKMISGLIKKKKSSVILMIEPNPTIYGCEFLNSHKEVFNFLEKLNLKNIKSNFDYGAKILNNENILNKDFNKYIGHVHISAPKLEQITIWKNLINSKKLKFLKNFKNMINLELLDINNEQELEKNISYFIEILKK